VGGRPPPVCEGLDQRRVFLLLVGYSVPSRTYTVRLVARLGDSRVKEIHAYLRYIHSFPPPYCLLLRRHSGVTANPSPHTTNDDDTL